jgi:sulfatase modifying factor 1
MKTHRFLFAVALAAACVAAPGPARAADAVAVPGGSYVPLFGATNPVPVAAFELDRHPVTNREFLEFVTAHPEWRRSEVTRLFAERGYLAHWAGDLDLGDIDPESPVTRVSWFAATAYAEAMGKRLPTLDEWEYVGAASETNINGVEDPGYAARILAWYSRPARDELAAVGTTFTNAYGVADMHGLIWEWVADFNTSLVTGESRADAGLDRQLFCGSGAAGATSFKDYAAFMRYAFRSSLKGNYCVGNLGFRCARDGER